MQEKAKTVMPAFKKHFEGQKFKKGTEVRLAMSRSGNVTSFVNGAKVRFVDTCTALLMRVFRLL